MTRSTRLMRAPALVVPRGGPSASHRTGRALLLGGKTSLVVLAMAASMGAFAGEPYTHGIAPYYGFVHWVSMGELDRAARQFAPDARVVAGPGCTVVAPCVGRDVIARLYLPRLRSGELPMPTTDQRFDGKALTTRGDTLEFKIAGEAPQLLRMWHRIEMGASGITSLRLEFDASDPATVQWLASRWPPGLAALP